MKNRYSPLAVALEPAPETFEPKIVPPPNHPTIHQSTNPPAPKPVGGALKRVSFGGITKKKEETKTAYPVFPDADGQTAVLAERILTNTEDFDALKGALEADKAELKLRVTPHYFAVNHQRHEIPSSVSVNSPKGEVLVSFTNRYPLLADESSVLGILGERTPQFFRPSFELKIKGDLLPADHTQELMDKLSALFAQYDALAALEVKEGVKPTEQFHTARHRELTPTQNLLLDQACPMVAMVKTKGRK